MLLKGSTISQFGIVAFKSSFYIFGGWTGDVSGDSPGDSNVIAAFDTGTKKWQKLGNLNQARVGHR